MDCRIISIKKYIVTDKGVGFILTVKGTSYDRDLILCENDVIINIDGVIYANEKINECMEYSPLRITEKFIEINKLFFKPTNL